MTEVSKTMIIILMLVGGSPSSTAGGMKTTTFAVLILNAFATFRSQENVETFGRRIECSVIKNASTIAMMYCMLFLCGGITISVYEGLPLLECLYEAASAVGTVGLTLGITPKLHIVSQFILIILMYFGRKRTAWFKCLSERDEFKPERGFPATDQPDLCLYPAAAASTAGRA